MSYFVRHRWVCLSYSRMLAALGDHHSRIPIDNSVLRRNFSVRVGRWVVYCSWILQIEQFHWLKKNYRILSIIVFSCKYHCFWRQTQFHFKYCKEAFPSKKPKTQFWHRKRKIKESKSPLFLLTFLLTHLLSEEINENILIPFQLSVWYEKLFEVSNKLFQF